MVPYISQRALYFPISTSLLIVNCRPSTICNLLTSECAWVLKKANGLSTELSKWPYLVVRRVARVDRDAKLVRWRSTDTEALEYEIGRAHV